MRGELYFLMARFSVPSKLEALPSSGSFLHWMGECPTCLFLVCFGFTHFTASIYFVTENYTPVNCSSCWNLDCSLLVHCQYFVIGNYLPTYQSRCWNFELVLILLSIWILRCVSTFFKHIALKLTNIKNKHMLNKQCYFFLALLKWNISSLPKQK